jgi:hypothetical protein
MRESETPEWPRQSNGIGGDARPWELPRSRLSSVEAGEVSVTGPVLRMPVRMRWAARWREVVRATNAGLGINPAPRWSWVPLASFAFFAVVAVIGLVRTFGQSEGKASAETAQLVNAAQEIRDGMVTMRGELMGEVSAIRGTVSAQQRQLDKLDSDIRAQLQLKDKEIARLEMEVATAMAYAQSADKNIARLQERVGRNGG